MQDEARELLDKALSSWQAQDYAATIEFARKATELDPENAEAYGALGVALSRANRADEATDALQTAIRLAPSSAKSYYNLAAHYYAVGNKPFSRSMAEEAVRLEPGHAQATELIQRLSRELSEEPRPAVEPATPPAAPEGQVEVGAPTPGLGATPPQGPASGPAHVYSQPPAPAYPAATAHSLQWVAGLRGFWDLIGWALILANLASFVFLATQVISPAIQAAMREAQTQSERRDAPPATTAEPGDAPASGAGAEAGAGEPEAPATPFDPVRMGEKFESDYPWFQPVSWALVLAMVAWWIVDLVDRRPSGGFIATGVAGMVFSLCCAPIAFVLFLVYVLPMRLSQPR